VVRDYFTEGKLTQVVGKQKVGRFGTGRFLDGFFAFCYRSPRVKSACFCGD
jgi:hypothetical protein